MSASSPPWKELVVTLIPNAKLYPIEFPPIFLRYVLLDFTMDTLSVLQRGDVITRPIFSQIFTKKDIIY